MEIRRRLPGDYAVRATTSCHAQGCGMVPVHQLRLVGERCHPERRGCHVAIWAPGRTRLRHDNLTSPLRCSMAGWQDETVDGPSERRAVGEDRP
jgi:hypothetical protein